MPTPELLAALDPDASEATEPERLSAAFVQLHGELATWLHPDFVVELLGRAVAAAILAPGEDPAETLRSSCASELLDRSSDVLCAVASGPAPAAALRAARTPAESPAPAPGASDAPPSRPPHRDEHPEVPPARAARAGGPDGEPPVRRSGFITPPSWREPMPSPRGTTFLERITAEPVGRPTVVPALLDDGASEPPPPPTAKQLGAAPSHPPRAAPPEDGDAARRSVPPPPPPPTSGALAAAATPEPRGRRPVAVEPPTPRPRRIRDATVRYDRARDRLDAATAATLRRSRGRGEEARDDGPTPAPSDSAPTPVRPTPAAVFSRPSDGPTRRHDALHIDDLPELEASTEPDPTPATPASSRRVAASLPDYDDDEETLVKAVPVDEARSPSPA